MPGGTVPLTAIGGVCRARRKTCEDGDVDRTVRCRRRHRTRRGIQRRHERISRCRGAIVASARRGATRRIDFDSSHHGIENSQRVQRPTDTHSQSLEILTGKETGVDLIIEASRRRMTYNSGNSSGADRPGTDCLVERLLSTRQYRGVAGWTLLARYNPSFHDGELGSGDPSMDGKTYSLPGRELLHGYPRGRRRTRKQYFGH